MLDIQDLSKLKITKVKNWAIYFTYDDEKYLLHGSCSDYEYGLHLYKRIPINECGKYKLDFIDGALATSDYIKNKYIKFFGKCLCYKKIDKEYFVNKLTWDGFCTSCFDKEINERKEAIQDHYKAIKQLEEQIQNIRRDIKDIEEFRV